MRVGLLGCGAVADIHASQLTQTGRRVVAYSPDPDEAERFAARHELVAHTSDIREALAQCDVVVIASPSQFHYPQALDAIEAGKHVLVEIPVCESAAETRMLGERATAKGVVLQCTHTSRYLEPYRRIGQWILSGRLGQVRQVTHVRRMAPRSRAWVDDALAHYAAHPLDFFLAWFGSVEPVGCIALPRARESQNVMLLARLANGAAAGVNVVYQCPLPQIETGIVGSESSITSDGFSYLRSDSALLAFEGDADTTYRRAIGSEDDAFLQATEGRSGGVPWSETIRLMEVIDQFRACCEPDPGMESIYL
jgi:2-hydroxy-4-carboxymuconate semialdehyde hemiacetal dehydrogenase